MGFRFREQQYGQCFFVTTSFEKHRKLGEIDGIYEALSQSLNHINQATESLLISYIFMPSHLHMVMLIKGDRLAGLMRDFKKFTAQKTIKDIVGGGKIWQDGYDRQVIYTEKVLITKINYIHCNPVKAGLVDKPEDWYYSSAADYAGRENGPVLVWKEWRF
jgi:REP element-mobilizing transposase RayT